MSKAEIRKLQQEVASLKKQVKRPDQTTKTNVNAKVVNIINVSNKGAIPKQNLGAKGHEQQAGCQGGHGQHHQNQEKPGGSGRGAQVLQGGRGQHHQNQEKPGGSGRGAQVLQGGRGQHHQKQETPGGKGRGAQEHQGGRGQHQNQGKPSGEGRGTQNHQGGRGQHHETQKKPGGGSHGVQVHQGGRGQHHENQGKPGGGRGAHVHQGGRGQNQNHGPQGGSNRGAGHPVQHIYTLPGHGRCIESQVKYVPTSHVYVTLLPAGIIPPEHSHSQPRPTTENTDSMTMFGAKDFVASLCSNSNLTNNVPDKEVHKTPPRKLNNEDATSKKSTPKPTKLINNYLKNPENINDFESECVSSGQNYEIDMNALRARFQALPLDQVRKVLPQHWALRAFPVMNRYITPELNPNSIEYLELCTFFRKTAPGSLQIRGIYRVENAFLWYHYAERKRGLAKLLGDEPQERQLFHGAKDLEALLESGFGWNKAGIKSKTLNHRLALTPNAANACFHCKSTPKRVVVSQSLQSVPETTQLDLLTGELPSEAPSDALLEHLLDDFSSYPAFLIEFEGEVPPPPARKQNPS